MKEPEERPAPTTSVESMNSGRVTAVELVKMLDPILGQILTLKFRPSLPGPANVVSWEALNVNSTVITRQLVLHAAVTDRRAWEELAKLAGLAGGKLPPR